MKATAPNFARGASWLAGVAALSVTLTASPGRAEPLVWPLAAAADALGQAGAQLADPFATQQRREAAFNRLTHTEVEQARTYLEKGRAAAAQGDTPAALHWYRKAKATGAQFGPGEYGTQQLADALRQAGVSIQELAAAPNPQTMPALTPDQAAAADRTSLPALLQSTGAPALGSSQTPFGGQVISNPNAIQVNNHPLIGNANVVGPRSASAAAPRVGNFDGAMRRLPMPTEDKPAAAAPPASNAKAAAQGLLAQARAALDRGDLAESHRLASQARDLQVPDSAFIAGETRPWTLILQIESEMNRRGQAVVQAGAVESVGVEKTPVGYPVQPALHTPETDTTRNAPASTSQVVPQVVPQAASQRSPGRELYDAGMNALQRQDREAALKYFREAWKHERTLDPVTRQNLQDHLGGLQAANPRPTPAAAEPTPIDKVSEEEQLAFQRMSREANVQMHESEAMMNNNPLGGLESIKKTRERIVNSDLSPHSRQQLLTMVDRTIEKMEKYIDENRATIGFNAENKAKLEQIDRERAMRLASQDRLAKLVEEFNQLLDQQRWAEAERVAMQAHEVAPNEEVVAAMVWKSRFIKAYESRVAMRGQKELNFLSALESVDESSSPFDDRIPMQFQDATSWSQLTKTRSQWLQEQGRNLSPKEMQIQDVLKEPVDVRFDNQPLSEVMDILSAAVGVNFHLNEEGLAAEGASSDMPINIQLREPVSLRSALNLILEPLHLSYVIRNEVLEITSETVRREDVVRKVYNVGDLVIPIPNFVPSYNMGLPGAIRAAQSSMPYGQAFGAAGSQPLTVMAQNDSSSDTINPLALAQMGRDSSAPSMQTSGARAQQSLGFGPGGAAGGVGADYDSLIELITATVAPESWDEVGGPGAIAPHAGNLSLVISQTQEIHEQIADLLEQLRRLQDLQVTIEVRFITINDNFFERIGIDFDFDIDDNSASVAAGQIPDDTGPSIVTGLDSTGNITTDGDISFTQNSFGSAVPAFGGFDPATAANFGFAILSDIEVFFLLQAAQGDSRTNVLQAPKVTLFNGQQAFVSDTTQRPFVTSVIPVVGDFAAAYAPVVVVLSEGTSLSVQAVVSNDRRFVRLTLVPFFSQIGQVQEFTFSGKKSFLKGNLDNNPDTDDDNITVVEEGTTVQLPTFAFTTVTTTVSVPDGGTVLLGGIKRLQEGRNERGLPLLSKVPYVSRLFKNVGIGRTTQSLMMMVTPRIIIQEEEEGKLGIDIAP